MIRDVVKTFLREGLYAIPAVLFMLVLFAQPLLGIVRKSVQQTNGEGSSLEAWAKVFTTPLFGKVAYTTLQISIGATMCSLLLAYPIAYFLAKQPPRRRALYLILVLVPFWTSSLVKSFSLIVLLGHSGIINDLLATMGIGPLKMLFNRIGVMIGMSHYLIPFAVFPIMTSLQNVAPELGRAAAIMGAGKVRIFTRITLPLSLPGVVAGALLIFVLSMGFYIIPALLGGRKDMMFANLVDFYTREVLNWPVASAVAVLLMLAAAVVAILLAKVQSGSSVFAEGRS